jgi:CheY-like chemotaxis protein
MEAVGRLAGGVAHDFNNLLSPILGYGEMLLDDLLLDTQNREMVEEILKAGQRSKALVQQLLAFGRKQAIDTKPVNLNLIIANFVKLLRRTVQENITIETIPGEGLPLILADSGQIDQVIMNLVINAQDAMPHGGVITIETSVVDSETASLPELREVQPGPPVMLSVSDNGIGMDEETCKKIFEPFFTTKELGKGTGLGLATVYGIICQHGGTVQVISNPGTGTTFKLYFPSSAIVTAPSESPFSALQETTGHETILVAEDNEMVRNLTVSILKRQGYQVLTAANCREAMNHINQHPIPLHLLLTDVIMPDGNGKDLYGKVSAVYPTIRVIYMSGYTGNVLSNHGILEEGIAFIQKPFSIKTLTVKVREVLDR